MKKLTFSSRLGLLATALLLAFGGFFIAKVTVAAITSTFTDVETVANLSAVPDQSAVTATTVANVPAGVDDQDAATATTQANVVGVQASDDSAGADGSTVTADAAGTSSNGISITITDDNTTDCAVATLGGITPAYTVDCDLDASVTAGTVLTATALTALIDGAPDLTAILKGTGGNTVTADTITLAGGVDAVAQINEITISGTPEEGDVFTATLPTVGDVDYTVLVTDTTNDLIAAGLNTAIQGSAGYAAQDFTSGVAGNVITLTAKVAGTGFAQTSGAVDKATAQVNEITITGTVEEGDVFTATLPTDGDVSYTVLAGDTTNDDIALGLNTAIQASLNYATQDFTSSVAGNVITLTAKVAGTGFVQTSSATNRTAIAQEVTFTPASVSVGETFRATINGTDYDYLAAAGNGVAEVVTALAPLMDANPDVVCSEDDLKVTCTAFVAGTPFTYAATVVDITPPSISSLSFTPSTGTAKIGDVITLNITSDQAGYLEDAITVNGEVIDALSFTDLGGGLYSATYTVISGNTDRASGATPASVVLDDGDGNSNAAYTTVVANTLAIDANAPTFVSAETTSTTTIDLTFSEDLDGSTVNGSGSEFAVAGHTVSGASETGTGVVTLTLSTIMGTEETPDVTFTNIDNFKDLAGNQAVSPTMVTADDGVAPVLSEITPVLPTPGNDDTPDYTFSSPDEGGAITVGGDCALALPPAIAGSNTITFGPLADGVYSNCTIKVTDGSGNESSLLAVTSFTVDTTPPTVVISSLSGDPTNDSPIFFTITFSEAVTGFTSGDVQLQNGGIFSLTPTSGAVYSLSVIPLGQGDIKVDIDASEVQDLAGNNNTAATQFGITYDSVAPVITMLGASPVNIEYGETYTDDGATASDTNDGDITGSIVTVDPVDTDVLGTYTVTYNVTDAAGNAATEVTRTVNVIQRAITVTAVTDTKEYDGTNSSSGIPSITSGSLASGDEEDWTQTYDNKNVGTGKTLIPEGIITDSFSGDDVTDNYAITFVTDTTGEITEKDLTITALASDKVYDGNNTASVVLSDDKISGDDVVVTNTGATFSDKNVGVGKTVTANFTLSGADLGNYTPTASPVMTTADITAKDLTVTATGVNKTFDGNTDATVDLSDDRVAGDVLTVSYISASFADADVGNAKPVSVTGISISGTDAGNYNLLNTTADTIADINPQPSSGGGSSGSRKISPTITPPLAPVSGEVLGAETVPKFIFTLFLKMGPPYSAAVLNEVMELQKFLNAKGFECGLVDGKFGPKTKACVVRFQLVSGLKGDGIVGPLTRAVLNK